LTAYDKAFTAYEASIAAVGVAGDPNHIPAQNFELEDCLKRFIATRTTETSRYNQIEGLKVQRKPHKIDCHEWEDYFLLANEAAAWLRGNDPVPTRTTLL
jgi:hypothetical protein